MSLARLTYVPSCGLLDELLQTVLTAQTAASQHHQQKDTHPDSSVEHLRKAECVTASLVVEGNRSP